MVNEVQSTQTNLLKKLRRNGRSKTLSMQPNPKGDLHVMSSTPPKKTKLGKKSSSPIDIMNLVHYYPHKIPSFYHPLRQIIPPLKVAHSTQTSQHGSYTYSPHNEYNISNLEYHGKTTSKLLKRPSNSISPMRYTQPSLMTLSNDQAKYIFDKHYYMSRNPHF